MSPMTGKITLDGQDYTWTSPRLKHLVEVEGLVGPITDLKTVNSVRGRVYLGYACLRDNHPDLTPGKLMDLSAAAFSALWTMIAAAIPIYGGGAGASEAGQPVPPALPAKEASESPDQPGSPIFSSLPSSGGPAGIPNEPESSG